MTLFLGHNVRRPVLLVVLLTLPCLFFLSGCAEEPGRLGGTLIVEGEHTVDRGEQLSGALLLAQGRLLVEEGGELSGPLYMLAGDLRLHGTVSADLTVLGGQVMLGPSARVAGDLNHGGGDLLLDPEATIGGELVEGAGGVSLPGLEEVERSPLERVLRFLLEPLLIAIFGYLLARFFPRSVTRVAQAAVEQPVISGAFGLLVLLVIPALLIMIAFTMILLPLALIGFLGGFFVVGYGWIAIGCRLGQPVVRRLHRPVSLPRATFLGTLLLMYLLQMLEWIPVAGFVPFVLAMAVGVGAVLLTRFGWRRYVPQPAILPPQDDF